MSGVKSCPKCGVAVPQGEDECPGCGIFLSKYEKAMARKAEREAASAIDYGAGSAPLPMTPENVAANLTAARMMEANSMAASGQAADIDGGVLIKAVIAGGFAALIAGIVWAVIGILTGYEIGYAAIGVGFLVGMAISVVAGGGGVPLVVIGMVSSLAGIFIGKYIWIHHMFNEYLADPENASELVGAPESISLLEFTFTEL